MNTKTGTLGYRAVRVKATPTLDGVINCLGFIVRLFKGLNYDKLKFYVYVYVYIKGMLNRNSRQCQAGSQGAPCRPLLPIDYFAIISMVLTLYK